MMPKHQATAAHSPSTSRNVCSSVSVASSVGCGFSCFGARYCSILSFLCALVQRVAEVRISSLVEGDSAMVRPISEVWAHFTVGETVGGKRGPAVCKYCNSSYAFPNATRLSKHIAQCVKCPRQEVAPRSRSSQPFM